jgi:hypothetical protein
MFVASFSGSSTLLLGGESRLWWMAKVVALDARIAVKSLYKHDIKAIGRKLLGSSLFPFLYIRMVVEVFQTEGICLLFRQRLKMSDKTLQLGSTCRRWRYSTRSLPGAELDYT